MAKPKPLPDPTNASNDTVRAVVRALDIILALGKTDDGASVVGLANLLHLPHPTVHRLLKTLEAKGFVSRDPASNQYYLSTQVLQLQGTIATRQSLVRPAIPVLTRLAKQLECSAHLAVLGEDRVVYVETRRSDPYTFEFLPPGRTNAIHCTALGKVLAAYLPAEYLQILVKRISFDARTPNTLTSPRAFLKCLDHVRDNGYAVDDEEGALGARCIAAPVYDHRDNCIAAISVSNTAAGLPSAAIPKVAAVVMGAAAELSHALGKP
jgi:DNA-binding IclR family transcriptional regulator